MSKDYEPSGFVLVQIKEHTILACFESREQFGDLQIWLKNVNAKSFIEALTDSRATDAAVSILDALDKAEKMRPEQIYQTTSDTPPVCARHHTPMKPSAKDPGGWYCNRKDGDKYCQNSVSSKGVVKNAK
jgi:hypothetical protein